jgi:hypothetical protein
MAYARREGAEDFASFFKKETLALLCLLGRIEAAYGRY